MNLMTKGVFKGAAKKAAKGVLGNFSETEFRAEIGLKFGNKAFSPVSDIDSGGTDFGATDPGAMEATPTAALSTQATCILRTVGRWDSLGNASVFAPETGSDFGNFTKYDADSTVARSLCGPKARLEMLDLGNTHSLSYSNSENSVGGANAVGDRTLETLFNGRFYSEKNLGPNNGPEMPCVHPKGFNGWHPTAQVRCRAHHWEYQNFIGENIQKCLKLFQCGGYQSEKKGKKSFSKTVSLLFGLMLLSGCNDMDNLFKAPKIPLKGQRISLYGNEVCVLGKGTFSAAKIQAPAKAVVQWGQPSLNAQHHMGSLMLDGDRTWPLVQIWKRSVSKEVILPVTPIANKDRIFIVDNEGFLSALDWTGKKIWSVQVNPQHDFYGMGGGLATDGQRVYITTPHRWILALDYCTGKVIWSHALNHSARNGPALSGNRIALLTLANQTILLDACTGKEIWDDQGLKEDTLILGGSVPAITMDRVVVGTASGEVVALSLGQGDRLWDRQLASMSSIDGEKNFRHIHAHPVVVEGHVYATSDSGQIACFELSSGDLVWTQDSGGMQTPIVIGDTLITITTTGRCVALDRHTGKRFWEIALPKDQRWLGPIMAGGLLYALSDKGELQVMDPLKNGTCVSAMSLRLNYDLAPIVVNGGLLFLSKNGVLSFYKRQCVVQKK
jgi:outer membrane protein assembly factor BamB